MCFPNPIKANERPDWSVRDWPARIRTAPHADNHTHPSPRTEAFLAAGQAQSLAPVRLEAQRKVHAGGGALCRGAGKRDRRLGRGQCPCGGLGIAARCWLYLRARRRRHVFHILLVVIHQGFLEPLKSLRWATRGVTGSAPASPHGDRMAPSYAPTPPHTTHLAPLGPALVQVGQDLVARRRGRGRPGRLRLGHRLRSHRLLPSSRRPCVKSSMTHNPSAPNWL